MPPPDQDICKIIKCGHVLACDAEHGSEKLVAVARIMAQIPAEIASDPAHLAAALDVTDRALRLIKRHHSAAARLQKEFLAALGLAS